MSHEEEHTVGVNRLLMLDGKGGRPVVCGSRDKFLKRLRHYKLVTSIRKASTSFFELKCWVRNESLLLLPRYCYVFIVLITNSASVTLCTSKIFLMYLAYNSIWIIVIRRYVHRDDRDITLFACLWLNHASYRVPVFVISSKVNTRRLHRAHMQFSFSKTLIQLEGIYSYLLMTHPMRMR